MMKTVRFSPKIAHRFRRGLLNGRKAFLETEGGQAFIVGVDVIEIDDVGILLVRLNSFDDLMFNIIQRLGVAGRPVLRATFGSKRAEPQFVCDAIHIQIEKDRGCRAIVMGGLVQ